MNAGKLMISRDPRIGKAMANDLVQKPPTQTVLDRFRALLKQREVELRASDEDDGREVPQPSGEEIVRFYEFVLSELTLNSKPLITDLTIVAGDHREHGQGIADAICNRIIEVPVEQKLPSLYLLDSIVKNIGREYVKYFSSRLPQVFCEAYRQVNPNLHPSMRHLFGTWSTVFPPPVLRKIEVQLELSQSGNYRSTSSTPLRTSESSRPACGIHVNPKYIRQPEHSVGDNNIQNSRGASSNSKIYGQKSSIGYDEYDSDNAEVISSEVGAQRLSSTGNVDSPGRLVERASTSHQILYGLGRLNDRDPEMSGWQGKNQYETSSGYNLSNGRDHQPARALIDAYGSDSRDRPFNDQPLQTECLDVNGIDSNVISWQNSEEEEFDWEDMSPTLADQGRVCDLFPASVPRPGPYKARPVFGAPSVAPETDYQKSARTSQTPLSTLEGSSVTAESAVPSFSNPRGSSSTTLAFQTKMNQVLGSRYPQEPWHLPNHLSQSSQQNINVRGRGKNFQTLSSGGRMSSSRGEQMTPLSDSFPDAGGKHRPLAIGSRMGFSSVDSMNDETGSAVLQPSKGLWLPANVHTSYLPPLHNIPSQQNHIRGRLDLMNAPNMAMNRGPNQSMFMPEQHLDNIGSKMQTSLKPPLGGLPQNQLETSLVTPLRAAVPSQLVARPLINGYTPQGHATAISTALTNPVPGLQLPLPNHSIPNSSFHFPGGVLPHLPSGLQPASSQNTVSNQPHGNAFSGLFNTLMAQGIISITNQAPTQDSVGIEFNVDLLKVRHESAINALYADLPRQCTTCGLRFKCQEEHSNHMDWHVTKNRMSKNRKQNLSRKWFVSASMWLRGAEAVGTEAVPGFFPIETEEEKKDDKDLAVPADEDQNVCALCGEAFDDFYSDETEEWMYRGAVYLNAPNGFTTDMDRSQLGPIVHDKCRSESSAVSPENFGQDGGETVDEGSQRKRSRISF